jgi:hypothetical protein
VVDHLQNATRESAGVERENPEHDEAQVRHARIGHESLHVLLHEAHERAEDDPMIASVEIHGVAACAAAGRRDRETDESVRPHLEQHAGQDDAPGSRSLGVSVGSQCGSGKSGTLIAKLSANAPKSQACSVAVSGWSFRVV